LSHIRSSLSALSLALGMFTSVHAAPYPDHAVRLIVPQAPGGASDVLARIIAQRLTEKWGQSVVVENRAGAGGNIGLEQVARAPADGYMLLMSYEGTQSINSSLYKHLSYDPVGDFAAVATVATLPFICIVNNGVPVRTFKEFVALAQSRPGMTFGSAGSGSVNHLLGEMVNMVAKTKLTHVPYKGAGPALTDLLGGRIDAVFTSVPSVAQQVETGNVRALAVTSAARAEELPKIPTIAESGYPGFDVNPWFGLFAPKNTPPEIVQKINTDIAAILDQPETVAYFAKQGATPLKSTSTEFKARLQSDIKKWEVVVRESGASVD
jgi:tripartite-type tricarboxylate transporter receptor subunit TctC